MSYPTIGSINYVSHVVPNFLTPGALAAAKDMTQNALAFVPGEENGFYIYDQALNGRTVYQDDFSTFGGWTLDETQGAWAKTGQLPTGGEMAPGTFAYQNNSWRGPVAQKDLGQNVTNGVFAANVNWSNTSAFALGRVLIVLYDAAFVAVGAIGFEDNQSGAINSSVPLWGLGFLPNATGTKLTARAASNGTRWVGIRKAGGTLTFFYPGGSESWAVAGGDVRHVRIYAQAWRDGAVSYPYVTAGAVADFMALLSPVNAAYFAQAISLGGGGSSATLANAFDNNPATQFSSGLLAAANYGGATYIGQAQPEASRYPSLAYVTVTNGTTGAATGNHPTSGRLLFADNLAGPWDGEVACTGLSQALGAVNYLVVPVGLAGRRYWRWEPTAGIGAGALWLVGDVQAFYAPAPPNPAASIPSLYADGTWNIDVPADGNSDTAKLLSWIGL